MDDSGYRQLGVSASKEEVKEAIKAQLPGLYPGAFCKIVEDVAGMPDYCTVVHADGAGTKSSLAYIDYRESGSAAAFKGIAQDSAVMNLDDMACIGAVDGFMLSNTIGRNAHLVGKEVLVELLQGYQDVADMLSRYDISMTMVGGETADVGDVVRTIIVDSTAVVRLPRQKVVNAANIQPGHVIIGLASFGQATYESAYNSGIGSNGYTRARHLLLHNDYAKKYPESFSPTIAPELVYQGRFYLNDPLPGAPGVTVGQALLAPTRTYLPAMKEVLAHHRESISGIIHASGGGLTKCLHFGQDLHYVKENPFETPPIFQALLDTGNISLKEAYKVFNMGQRYEIYAHPQAADAIIATVGKYNIAAKLLGEVAKNGRTSGNALTIKAYDEVLEYKYR